MTIIAIYDPVQHTSYVCSPLFSFPRFVSDDKSSADSQITLDPNCSQENIYKFTAEIPVEFDLIQFISIDWFIRFELIRSMFFQRQLLTAIPPSRSRNVPELAAPELPIPQPPRFTEVPTAPPAPVTTTTIPTTTTTHPRPIIPSVVHRPAAPALTCISCGEADMSDPTADCSAVTEEACDSTARFCVTKQTQISTSESRGKLGQRQLCVTGSFATEKRCLSEKDATVFLPGEKVNRN